MSTAKPPIWTVLKAHFLADVRKTGVLLVLFLVMIVVYAKFFFKSSAPSEADASTSNIVVDQNSARPQNDWNQLARTKRTALSSPICRRLEQDPFNIDLNKFPMAPGSEDDGGSLGVETVMGRADEAIRAAASELELQSTMVGDTQIACINNQFVRPGDKIAGFTVERIETMRVVLRHGDIRVALTLPMK